jgi:hypothetical protein
MFGNKNAGAHETSMRFRISRRNGKSTGRRIQQAISIPGNDLEQNERGDMYFAVRSLFRWTL